MTKNGRLKNNESSPGCAGVAVEVRHLQQSLDGAVELVSCVACSVLSESPAIVCTIRQSMIQTALIFFGERVFFIMQERGGFRWHCLRFSSAFEALNS